MKYGYTRTVTMDLDQSEIRIKETLIEQGFGVLTEIDIQKAFNDKLGIEFRRYRILGACNPQLAHQALCKEPGVGLLMPCTVVLWENQDGTVTISIAKASALLSCTETDFSELATEVDDRLSKALQAM
jgi:uncharacterized protein (DUF302 family)